MHKCQIVDILDLQLVRLTEYTVIPHLIVPTWRQHRDSIMKNFKKQNKNTALDNICHSSFSKEMLHDLRYDTIVRDICSNITMFNLIRLGELCLQIDPNYGGDTNAHKFSSTKMHQQN